MKFVTSFYYTFATKIFSLFLLLLSRVLTARMLGPADLGSLGNALNFTTIISRWGTFGIAPATQFISSKYSLQRNTLCIYTLLSSILIGVLHIVLIEYFKAEILDWQFQNDRYGSFAFLEFILWMPFIILSMTLPVLFLGSGQMTKYSITQILPGLLQTIVIAIAYYLPPSSQLIITAQLVCWISTVVVALFLIDYKNFKFEFDAELLKVYVKYALKTWPQVIIQFGIARFAVLIGSQYLSSKNLGYYILASNLSESFLVINASVTPLIFNRIASKGANIALLFKSLRFSNFTLIFIYILIVLIGKPVFLLFFGRDFDQTWNLFLLLFVSIFFHGMIRICLNYLSALGRNMVVSGIQLIELSILFMISILSCPIFGVISLCYSSICASLVGFILCLVAIVKVEKGNFSTLSIIIPDKDDISFLLEVFRNKKKINNERVNEK